MIPRNFQAFTRSMAAYRDSSHLHDTLAHSMMAMLSEVRLLRKLQAHDPASFRTIGACRGSCALTGSMKHARPLRKCA